MWSFWSRDPTKDFPYEIGDIVTGLEDVSIWVLHKGKKKANGEPVSIFRHEMKPGKEDLFEKAKSAAKRLRTLRHPNILTFVDSMEAERFVCIVTEYVQTLDKYISNINEYTTEQKKFSISWGLHQVAKGLGFLINDCNLNHNNIFIGSIFVNGPGNWKIGGLEYVSSNTTDTYPIKYEALDKYQPPNCGSQGTKWSSDSWGLGCLIWEVFNGTLSQTTALKSTGKIPKSLCPLYVELTTSNQNKRPSPLDFLERSRTQNGFMKNNFIDAMLFLEEIQIKEPTEKNRFFTNLDNQLESFPSDICKNKILPQLVNAFEFGNAGSAVLGPLFKIGKRLDDDEYQKKIIPCIVKLFAHKDRATRAKLLQQMELFIKHLQKNVVNDQVYCHVAQGFIDSNPTIREQTVKCMLHLAPKLNYSNLNEDVLKHFTRLQSRDEEGGIRTNTVVCMGKIACYLNPQIRQTSLIPAFLRSMRDPFPPARIAGILALSATQNFYTLRDTATRVMPALCHLTMDPEKSVREQAFKALKGFVSKIEKVSEDPALAAQMEADLNAASSEASTALAASWAGWAVSSLTSKFYRSKTPTTSVSSEKSISPASLSENKGKEVTASKTPLSKSISQESVENNVWGNIEDGDTTSGKVGTNDWGDADGWDDFDSATAEDPIVDIAERRVSLKNKVSNTEKSVKNGNGWENDNDDAAVWDSLADKSNDKAPSTPLVLEEGMSLAGQTVSRQRAPTDKKKEPGTASSAGQAKPKAAKKGPMKLGAQKIS